MPKILLAINPDLDRGALARRFQQERRVQVKNFLTRGSAEALAEVIANHTPWGLSWRHEGADPQFVRREALTTMEKSAHAGRDLALLQTMKSQEGYAFQFASYPMLDAYLQKWDEGGPHDIVLEHLNDAPFLDAVRDITGIAELLKADAQATLYAPGHFLAQHNDSHVAEGWRVAYVLNLCPVAWRPDWGGYLNFLDADGDISCGWMPRFNCLNLFAVPQPHNVSFVAPFAPVARFAITGWLRDR